MQKTVLKYISSLLAITIAFSVCYIFNSKNKNALQEEIDDVLIVNRSLTKLMSLQVKNNFSKANGEIILHSYLKKEPLSKLSDLLHNNSYIFYLVSESACNPCISELNEKVLLALNEIDKSLFFIVGTKSHTNNQANIMEYLNIDLKQNLLISFDQFFVDSIEPNTFLMLFTMNHNLKCNNFFVVNDLNVHLVPEFLLKASPSFK